MKYRNAGQVCVSPTRFFVHEKVYDKFVGEFIDHRQGHQGRRRPRPGRARWARSPIRAASTRWRRIVADAQEKGAKVATGGKRIGNQGNFFEPTVLTDVPDNARIMNEEPFGPVAVMLRFKDTDEVLDAGQQPALRPRQLRLHARTPRRRPRSPTRSTAAW